jgi:hypothetical protein
MGVYSLEPVTVFLRVVTAQREGRGLINARPFRVNRAVIRAVCEVAVGRGTLINGLSPR